MNPHLCETRRAPPPRRGRPCRAAPSLPCPPASAWVSIRFPRTLTCVVSWSEFPIVPSHPHICSAMVGVPHCPLLLSLPASVLPGTATHQRRTKSPFASPFICTGARRSPAACRANPGSAKRRFAKAGDGETERVRVRKRLESHLPPRLTQHTLEPLAWHWSHWPDRLVNWGGPWLFSERAGGVQTGANQGLSGTPCSGKTHQVPLPSKEETSWRVLGTRGAFSNERGDPIRKT